MARRSRSRVAKVEGTIGSRRSSSASRKKKLIAAVRSIARRGNFKRISLTAEQVEQYEKEDQFFPGEDVIESELSPERTDQRPDYGVDDPMAICIIDLYKTGGYREGQELPITDVAYNLYTTPAIIKKCYLEFRDAFRRQGIVITGT